MWHLPTHTSFFSWGSCQLLEFDETTGSCWNFLQSFEKHDTISPHWLGCGGIVKRTRRTRKYEWCSVQPSGGDSKWKRSESGRQGLKPSSFSPRLTSVWGISPAGNFCCVNTQPYSTRQDRGGDFVCRWCSWVFFFFFFSFFVIVEVQLIIIWSALRVEKRVASSVFCLLKLKRLSRSVCLQCCGYSVCLLSVSALSNRSVPSSSIFYHAYHVRGEQPHFIHAL